MVVKRGKLLSAMILNGRDQGKEKAVKSELTSRREKQSPAASGHAVHERSGGSLPELASRAHSEMIERVVWAAVLETERFRELARREDVQG